VALFTLNKLKKSLNYWNTICNVYCYDTDISVQYINWQ